MEDLVEKEVLTPDTTEDTTVETTETIEQDPLKAELEKVQQGGGRTEKEKAEFSLRKTAERIKALGGDPMSVLGIEKDTEDEDNEDDKPVTLGMLKKMQQETATKTALQLAEEIENETERELAKWHLENTIKSSGNPQNDLKMAMNQVNALKNEQIREELARKGKAKTFSSASSVDANRVEEIVYTPEELQMMKPPFNLTREEIINSRKK